MNYLCAFLDLTHYKFDSFILQVVLGEVDVYDVTVYGDNVGDFPSCAWPKVKALENKPPVDTLCDTIVFESLSDTVSVKTNY